MNNFNFARAHNSYLDPPDEPEAVHCDDCGEEMEPKRDLTGDYYVECHNKFCPGKFEGDAKEMAELLIGANDLVKSLAAKLRMANNYKIGQVEKAG